MVKPDCGRLDNKSKASDWEKNALSSVAPLQRGFDLPTSQLQDGEFPVVYSNGVLNFHRYAMVEGPGVVTGRSGTIGNVHYLENDFWPHNTTLWVTDFRGNYPKFVFYLYQFIDLSKFSTGSGVPTLNRNDVHAHTVRIPPLTEQKAIASALSDVDALIESLDRLIAKKRDIKQAAMQELLTGKRRLPGFEGAWVTKRLGEMGNFFKGSGIKKDDTQSGDLPCVRYGEIYTTHHNCIREFSSWISREVADGATRIRCGDILFAGSGETKEEIGKCVALVGSEEAFAGGDIVVLRPKEACSAFLGYYLNTAPINRQKASLGQGDAIVHISSAALANIEVSIPESIEEQNAIAEVLLSMDIETAALGEKMSKVQNIKQGMMQELLTGRIRLV